ncbi:MAG: TetR/AcrR family transcriptional regulator [Nocardioidaceae bacterium]|nr:TetR/AcrR family transcriptional regulator [Nocardioidaceae bacterium]
MAGPGRRPGAPDTRGAILAAARAAFAERGFDRTTSRAIAAAAGVTPGLVHHYFGSKADLLVAALELPFDPRDVLGPALPGPPELLGRRIATAAVGLWEDTAHRDQLLAYLRTAMTNPEAARTLRLGIPAVAVPLLSQVVPGPDVEVRVNLAMTQILGMAVLRYAIGLEPLASVPAEELIDRLAPVLQQHLLG